MYAEILTFTQPFKCNIGIGDFRKFSLGVGNLFALMRTKNK